MKSLRGFTLVELVIVIALSAVVLVMITAVLKRPLDAFIDQSRRGELVELASVALNRMARDAQYPQRWPLRIQPCRWRRPAFLCRRERLRYSQWAL